MAIGRGIVDIVDLSTPTGTQHAGVFLLADGRVTCGHCGYRVLSLSKLSTIILVWTGGGGAIAGKTWTLWTSGQRKNNRWLITSVVFIQHFYNLWLCIYLILSTISTSRFFGGSPPFCLVHNQSTIYPQSVHKPKNNTPKFISLNLLTSAIQSFNVLHNGTKPAVLIH